MPVAVRGQFRRQLWNTNKLKCSALVTHMKVKVRTTTAEMNQFDHMPCPPYCGTLVTYTQSCADSRHRQCPLH